MADRDAVAEINKLCPLATAEFEGESCVGLRLTSDKDVLGGVARRLSPGDKKHVLSLISRLTELKTLDLRRNRFGFIPDLGLERLEWLDLGSNYMGSVPDWLRRLPLTYLNLGVNELREIPEWVGGLPLTTLKLHKNEIASVDAIRPLKDVRFLNLYFNRIKPFPEFVWEFPEVQFFSWGVSGITSISDGLCNWRHLEWLSLVANRIESLPDCICGLTALRGLRLNKNRLSRLPDHIGRLVDLRHLFLYKNCIRELPPSFSALRLEKLNLARNEFPSRPDVEADWCVGSEDECSWF